MKIQTIQFSLQAALLAALLAFVLALSPLAAQQTYTWTQGSGAGGANSLWGTSANWLGSPDPLVFDNQTDIIFNSADVVNRGNAISIGGHRTIRSLTINADYETDNNALFLIRTFSTHNSGTANLTFAADTGNASITLAESTSGTQRVRLGESDGGDVVLDSNLDLAQNNTFIDNLSFWGSVSGAGTINKTGLGVVRLLRDNSGWSGGMNINEGEVLISNHFDAMGTGTWTLGGGANNTTLIVGGAFQDQAYNNAGGLVVADGAGSRTIANTEDFAGNPTLSGAITLNKDATFAITQYTAGSHDRLTLSEVVSGDGGIVKTDGGILILSADNTYTGTTDIQEGKLYLGGAGRLGTGDVTIASGANLDFGTGSGQQNIVANNISGEGEIIQSTAGTDTRITGDITSTGGLTINSGTFRIGNATTTGSYTGDTVINGGTLAFARSNAYTHNGTISGAGGVAKVNDGVVTVTGNNSYSGTTALFGGVLVADHANALGSGDIVFNALGGQATLRYTANSAATDWSTRFVNSDDAIRLDTNGENITLAGNIASSNTGGLAKSGAGTLTLGGANTYTGATTVSAGTLLINGSTASGSAVTVSSGATLGGTGTINGDLTLADGAFFAFDPLDTNATFNIGGTLTINSSFGVGSLRDLSGGLIDWDLVADNTTFTLIAGDNLPTFNASNIANFGIENKFDIGGGRSAYFQDGSLQLVVVPEPATYALIGGLLALGAVLIRRRMR